ncbi:diacylglycerol kinase eta-like isoform X2 [Carcharodon carcharias]|uniref:diacylglycerol kinase eta-like isoform X2 n=1 Tax=Carcharodon carcharias TaxID=13397 RepID=UPI001B7E010C|nr:diacylglycerol kinase eta-like isoform X2 [Carcharodon carcharias]
MEELYHSYCSRSPVWEEMESEKAAAAGAMAGLGPGAPQQQAAGAAGDESSDSDGEHEGPQKLIRKVSTSGQIRSKILTITGQGTTSDLIPSSSPVCCRVDFPGNLSWWKH